MLVIFDAEFHYKMAAKTVKRPMYESFLQHSKVEKKFMLDNLCNTHQLSTGRNICSSVGEGGGGDSCTDQIRVWSSSYSGKHNSPVPTRSGAHH